MERPAEIMFRYFMPNHARDVYVHFNADVMFALLRDIDDKCRSILKYSPEANKERDSLAQYIRDMINEDIDLTK